MGSSLRLRRESNVGAFFADELAAVGVDVRDLLVELKDPDLQKFAEEAQKLRQKALQQKKDGAAQPNGDQQDGTDSPGLTGGGDEQPTTGGGKSDMQAPQQ